ncbi:MAG: helix-turn-helix domain-containing protein [Candidatus Eisenbacteria bacterium]|uniref:Helix-turn-helix domain-containing protein n=1 Tax=Eiseniibacteriota bacterium TaxID=2212470 RepID=A0A538TVU2_UNCEI|nr:MAG: helix-turn-helix domain-containing protein [Candidatus Eisenbacteria bacterium]
MRLRLRRTLLWSRRLDPKTRDAGVRVRCRELLKVAAGMTRNVAARELGCVPSTAVRIVARFASHGEAALRDGRTKNERPAVDDGARALELLARAIGQVLDAALSVTCGRSCGGCWCVGDGRGRRCCAPYNRSSPRGSISLKSLPMLDLNFAESGEGM